MELLFERKQAIHQEHAEDAPGEDRSDADIAVQVAPVEDDCRIIPKALMEDFVDDIAARKFEQAA